MRTREQIENDKRKLTGDAFASTNLSIEVLLDNRDLLIDIRELLIKDSLTHKANMKDFTEIRERWYEFSEGRMRNKDNPEPANVAIADFFESELSKFIEGKKKEIIQHDELQKKGDNDYTRGWNNFRDFVLSLFDNQEKI